MLSSKNAFMEQLSPLGFELFPAVVVDIMHESELGVAKTILRHLIRILYCVGPGSIALLNERYAVEHYIQRLYADAHL